MNFLNVTVSLVDGEIVTSLLTKATDTHQYLLPSSIHPPHVHKNLPFGLGLRVRSTVSNQVNVLHRMRKLSNFLIRRGYLRSLVETEISHIKPIPRKAALKRSGNRNTTEGNNQRSSLVCTWSDHLPKLQAFTSGALPILHSCNRLASIFKRLTGDHVIFGGLLVLTHSSRSEQNQPAGSHLCRSPRCKTCISVKQNLTELKYSGAKFHQINQNFTCISNSVINFLQCSVCNCVCVGETGCLLRDRITQHRSFNIT